MAEQLNAKPGTTGYLIYYGGTQSPAADFEKFLAVATKYLVETGGIDQARIKIIRGPEAVATLIELWLVPAGAAPPIPTPKAGVSRAPSRPSGLADASSKQKGPSESSPTRPRTVPKKD